LTKINIHLDFHNVDIVTDFVDDISLQSVMLPPLIIGHAALCSVLCCWVTVRMKRIYIYTPNSSGHLLNRNFYIYSTRYRKNDHSKFFIATIMSDTSALYQICGETIAEEARQVQEAPQQEQPLSIVGEFRRQQLDKPLQKGTALHKMMLANDKQAGQMFDLPRETAESNFQHVDDLETWGYTSISEAVDDPQPPMLFHVNNVLDTMRLDSACPQECDNSVPMKHDHDKPCLINGVSYPPTQGSFMQVINPDAGLIVAFDNLSPLESSRGHGFDETEVPDLKNWSDVAYLQWKSRTFYTTSNLKFVLRHWVTNTATNYYLTLLHDDNGTDTTDWPGISYNAASREGRVLLGTPNGSSVAYMLIQHKRDLGQKTVDKIQVFKHYNNIMLLFHIVDVEEQEGDGSGKAANGQLPAPP
jgi:hypothetical protein